MTTKLTFQNEVFSLESGGTVLDSLIQHGFDIPNSCRAGACQSCLMQAIEGKPDDKSQAGLKDTLKAQNFFLACQCTPSEDLTVVLPSPTDTTIECEITGKTALCHNVVSLRIMPRANFPCRAGQYINLVNQDASLIRSYSIANLPEEDGFIELHVRKIENGRMSAWVHEEAAVGDTVYIRGPAGHCFYLSESDNSFPILLAGTGTGLAPLEGIVLDALKQGHKGNIHIVHGALKKDDLYDIEKLRNLSQKNSNVTYTPCVLNMDSLEPGFHAGSLADFIDTVLKTFDKSELRAYFCGVPDMVNTLKTKAFLSGVASKNIFSDPFITAAEQ